MEKDSRTILFGLFFLILMILVIVFSSCTKTVSKNVEVHDTIYIAHNQVDTTSVFGFAHENNFVSKADTVLSFRIDTIVKSIVKHDSILVRDSIYIKEKNDSIYIYKEKWNTKVITNHDTIYKAKVDTIFKSVTDTVYKTKTDTIKVHHYHLENDSVVHHNTSNSKVTKVKWKWYHTVVSLLWIALTIVVAGWIWKRWKE